MTLIEKTVYHDSLEYRHHLERLASNQMEKNMIPNNLAFLIEETKNELDQSLILLDKILQLPVSDEDESGGGTIVSIQLILQYRMGCENALALLLNIDHNLLYLLGIQPHHSAKMNLDRLAYAVGNDDLKQILNLLALLVKSLAKITARYKKDQASFAQHHKEPEKRNTIVRELQKLAAKQESFQHRLDKIHLEVEQLLRQQGEGPVFDHIAALRGPISQFHQAMMHGLEKAAQLYQKVNQSPVLEYQIDALLKKAEEVLHIMPGLYKHQPANLSNHVDQKTNAEQLEQRAAAKRLRPFFG